MRPTNNGHSISLPPLLLTHFAQSLFTMKKLFLTLVCMIVTLAFTSCGSPTPADAAANCIELLKNKDYEAFVETMNIQGKTAEDVQQTKEGLVSMLQQKGDKMYEKKGNIESYTLLNEEISADGQKATVQFEITYGNGSKDNEKLNMILVDGEWKQDVKK